MSERRCDGFGRGTYDPTGPAPPLTNTVSPAFALEYSFHAMYAVLPGIPVTPTK